MSGDNNRFEATFGSSGSGGGGGGISSVDIQNTLYVAKNGNDSTGTRNDLTKPYLTIAGATADATAQDCIYVYRGSYTETSVDTFGTNLFYYLEPNVEVINDTTALIQDSSGAKNITIFGYGNLTCLVQPTINISNATSNLTIQCNNIASANSILNFDGTKLEIDCNKISSQGAGITYAGSSAESYINFNRCVMSGTSTTTLLFNHSSGTLRFSGNYYEQAYARSGGVPIKTTMTSTARLTIDLKEFIAIGGGYSGIFTTTGDGVSISNMLKKGGSAFQMGNDASNIVDFYNCQMKNDTDMFEHTFAGVINCFNCYFYQPQSRVVTLNGTATLNLVDCIINQPQVNSIIALTQSGTAGSEINPRLILQNVFLYNEVSIGGESIDGSLVLGGSSKIPIYVQGTLTCSQDIDTANVENAIAGNAIVVDADVRVTDTYIKDY